MANEVVASYYDLANRTDNGFRFLPIQHDSKNLGGVLTQASILAGLSDGRESNPVKRVRGWLARSSLSLLTIRLPTSRNFQKTMRAS